MSLPPSAPAAKPAGKRADIRLAEIAIEAAEKDLGLARAMRWDDIGVGLFVEGERLRDEPEGISTEGLIGMKLSVPLPVWNTGGAAVEERRIIAQRRMEMLETLRRLWRTKWMPPHSRCATASPRPSNCRTMCYRPRANCSATPRPPMNGAKRKSSGFSASAND